MKFFALLIVFTLYTGGAGAQVTTDTIQKIVSASTDKILTALKTQSKEGTDSNKATVTLPAKETETPHDVFSDVLSFMPIVFFITVMIILNFKIKHDDKKLSDFLNDKEQQLALKKEETKVKVANLEAKEEIVKSVAGNPEAVREVITNQSLVAESPPEQTDPGQSVSRYIVVLTGLTALFIACCMASFYFYRWSRGDKDVNFNSLSTVLYGLGIGIIPYGFTKVASMINKDSKS